MRRTLDKRLSRFKFIGYDMGSNLTFSKIVTEGQSTLYVYVGDS